MKGLKVPYHAGKGNFFGLDREIAKRAFDSAKALLSGGRQQDVPAFGEHLRADAPCIFLGSHEFHTYTNTLLPDLHGRFSKTADALRYALRINEAAKATSPEPSGKEAP